MIYPQTMLTVADNTGAKKIMCIRVLGGNKKYAEIGDTIIAVVKEAIPNMPIKRSDVIRAIIVRTRKTIRRSDGMYIRFDDNAGVIVNIDNLTNEELFLSLQAERENMPLVYWISLNRDKSSIYKLFNSYQYPIFKDIDELYAFFENEYPP